MKDIASNRTQIGKASTKPTDAQTIQRIHQHNIAICGTMMKFILQSLMLCVIFFTTRATEGQWSNWGPYGTCSETCQSNIKTDPTQSRTRTCNGGTFGTTCPGSGVDIRNCNVGVGCQGSLTQWSAYGACSATCQTGIQPPTQQRRRTCERATFGGNCNGAVLVQITDCNVEVACTGQWFKWGAYDTCSTTCQSNINVPPTRSRTRTCNGGRTTCSGSSVETQFCNVRVACQGNVTSWSDYSACSSTCQPVFNTPTQRRTRTCVGATFGGDCNGASLNESIYCNLNVACPGKLSPWEQWGACSESCQGNSNVAPTKSRARNCSEATFYGNCRGASLTESKTCNAGVDCQDGDQDKNKTIIIVASASIVSTLILILIIFLIVKFKAKITCGTKSQNSNKNEGANDKYDDVAETNSPSAVPPKVYAELTPISENFDDYQEINLYQNSVQANTGV
ncbi:adhesion G protein-coupled receptor B1-like isoform X2 [Hydractinia symbiolongicarpus]|uniref:adhesion G protein-coupled receptor B1-like isoform X2 n=1 Tax=Hydractinia symbiolongicarpus TaxID=13093 RepID=UPI0025510F50|nr:adhesion G protein-coupled receptor B1-like isoform X2 [Hydractinia symbiolongicarpus]